MYEMRAQVPRNKQGNDMMPRSVIAPPFKFKFTDLKKEEKYKYI